MSRNGSARVYQFPKENRILIRILNDGMRSDNTLVGGVSDHRGRFFDTRPTRVTKPAWEKIMILRNRIHHLLNPADHFANCR